MTKRAKARLGVTVAVAVLSGAALLGWRAWSPPRGTVAPQSAPTVEAYGESARAILRPLAETAVDGKITADVAAVASAKRALVALTVPAAVRDAHLAAVLALSRVEQDPEDDQARRGLFAAIRPLIE